MKQGQVILVGAGPGDPELLTVGGRRALLEAEVVVYDRLVSKAILDLIPENAQRIDVGKQAGCHPVPQQQINAILREKALEGKRVVRLKGGDPFLFGRGGEELEGLSDIPFRQIPGIPSALAVPAYAGIPVTHRDFCASLHIVTGHRRAGTESQPDYEALVRTEGTLVFLMGVSALPDICRGLLRGGMDPDMPAAVIENGTLPAQRSLLCPLSRLPEAAAEAHIQSPAVIVVGRVCALSPRFNWFDRLPLRGKQVIVTRPKDRARELSRRLRQLGAEVTEFPCIETVPRVPCPEMADALDRIESYGWLVFTSPAGVSALMEELARREQDVRALGRISIAAIGPGTDRELRKHGLRADLIPDVYDGAHLGQALCSRVGSGRVLLLRAQWGTRALTDALQGGKIQYDDIACYDTRLVCPDPAPVRALLEKGPFVTFTSASTVRGFVRAMEGAVLTGITGVCLGAQTAREAEKYGLRTLIAREATMDALIRAITEGVNHETCL